MKYSHLLILNFLVFANSVIAVANPLCKLMHKKPSVACEFQLEKGNYNYSEDEILEYYEGNPETRGLFKQIASLKVAYTLSNLIQPAQKQTFKLTNNNEFQAQNWYTYSDNLKFQQMRWETQVQSFNKAQHEVDFNSAKRALFSKYPFSMQNYEIQLPYATLSEWGGLAHPPIQDSQLKNLQEFSRFYEPIDYSHNKLDSSRLFNVDFQINLDKISHSELSKGNSYHLLADSKSFSAKMASIQSAAKTIWLSSLVFVDDITTNQIVAALIKKANDGIEVRIITENAMSYIHPQQIKKMQAAGIKVLRADDFFNFNTQAIYHSKVLVIDDHTAIIGGQNMIDADLGSNGTDFKNRDLDVQISGPLVTDITISFVRDWNYFVKKEDASNNNKNLPTFESAYLNKIGSQKELERKNGLRGQQFYLSWLSNRQERMHGLGRFIAQKPYLNGSTITDAYIQLIQSAQNYLGITNPQAVDTYTVNAKGSAFNPIKDTYTNYNRLFLALDETIKSKPNLHVDYLTSNERYVFNEAVPMTLERIKKYLSRGKILFANLNQLWLDSYSLKYAEPQYLNLMKDYLPHSNVNVWLHVSFIHSKVLYVDRIAASIGSFNLHHNATDHAYESTVVAMDADLNKQLDQAMVYDMANSNPFIFKNIQKAH